MKFIDKNNFNLLNYKLTAEEYQLKIKENPRPLVIDIRQLKESLSGTVENAYRIPQNEFADCLIQLPPFGTIILYSDLKNNYIKSTMELLWKNGFNDIFYVDGGYLKIMETLIDVSESDIEIIRQYLTKNGKSGILLDIEAYSIKYEYISDQLDFKKYKYIDLNGVKIYFLHSKLRLVNGTTIKWENDNLIFNHPRWHTDRDIGTLKTRIQKVLDRDINPMVASHGGFVKLHDVQEDIAYVEMTGGCQGCGLSEMTLKQGIEAAIFQSIPEISQVLDKTDHSAGTNPYYVND